MARKPYGTSTPFPDLSEFPPGPRLLVTLADDFEGEVRVGDERVIDGKRYRCIGMGEGGSIRVYDLGSTT